VLNAVARTAERLTAVAHKDADELLLSAMPLFKAEAREDAARAELLVPAYTT
jgi:hypothetical protein